MKRLLCIILAVVGLLAFGGVAGATNPFTDIAGNTHEANIDAVYHAAVTAGCNQAGDQYCPSNQVTRDQMASFLARVAGLSSGNTKHFPVANARGPAQSFCTLASRRSSSYPEGPCQMGAQRVATADSSGLFSSIAIGADQMPIIAFYHFASKGELEVLHCGNPACTAYNTTAVVDNTTDDVGYWPSLAIGTDGLPVISYYEAIAGRLKIAHCDDIACTSAVKSFPDPDFGDSGLYSSLAIGADGRPIVSFYDSTNGDLRVSHCQDIQCTVNDPSVLIDGGGDTPRNVGQYSSIAISNGKPKIGYYDATNKIARQADCTNATCTGFVNPGTVALAGAETGEFVSAAAGTGGSFQFSYYDRTNGDLRIGGCGGGCSSRLVASEGDVGAGTAMIFGNKFSADPFIAYFDNTNHQLRVLTPCDCPGGATTRTVSVPGNTVGKNPSIALGVDGMPVVAFYDETAADLMVAS